MNYKKKMNLNIFQAKIKDGKISFLTEGNEVRFDFWAKKNEGKQIRIVPHENKRSKTQNNYYWAYLGLIEIETGNSANDLHEYFKRKHLPARFTKIMGKEIRLPATTTTLSKADFGEYLDKICAESGVPLPDPREAGYIPNYQTF